MKLRSLLSLETTEDEYRANIAGMNTFFGAVLGFVLADIRTDDLRDFAMLLLFIAAIVISILYVSASPRRWASAVMTALFIWALPWLAETSIGEIGRLQVTLAVWLFMAIILETIWALQKRREARRAPPPAI